MPAVDSQLDAFRTGAAPQTSTGLAASLPHEPTLFGLTPTQLHDHYWASRGVQVVRLGEAVELAPAAELFLLADPRTLAAFRLRRLANVMVWVQPRLLVLRLHDDKEHGYRERVVADARGRFVRFERHYAGSDTQLARLALTTDRRLAQLWQQAADPRAGWNALRQAVPRTRRAVRSVEGQVFDRQDEEERLAFVRHLVETWRRPDASIRRVRKRGESAWVDPDAQVDPRTRFVGPVWVGAGRRVPPQTPVVGPVALWDDPAMRPHTEQVRWLEIEPVRPLGRAESVDIEQVHARRRGKLERWSKRAFDIAFALTVLLLTAPLYPLIMLAIWVEDGRPFFFGHARETLGGREFLCWKFRSMRKDAEAIKQKLQAQNKADGPQFFIENDPRLTRIGWLIRKTNLDEIPQFFNVLVGDMSVVGPRPSPNRENQFCPTWREARLSVRPGITGLWQVSRSRQEGLDFQEWIRYDIEYVERGGWGMDLMIICRTFAVLLKSLWR